MWDKGGIRNFHSRRLQGEITYPRGAATGEDGVGHFGVRELPVLTQQTAEGVVNWTIPGRTPEPIRPILLTGDQKPEKVVCKKTLRTGTLASYERFCLTPTEWAKQSDEAKAEWGDMQGTKGSTKGQ